MQDSPATASLSLTVTMEPMLIYVLATRVDARSFVFAHLNSADALALAEATGLFSELYCDRKGYEALGEVEKLRLCNPVFRYFNSKAWERFRDYYSVAEEWDPWPVIRERGQVAMEDWADWDIFKNRHLILDELREEDTPGSHLNTQLYHNMILAPDYWSYFNLYSGLKLDNYDVLNPVEMHNRDSKAVAAQFARTVFDLSKVLVVAACNVGSKPRYDWALKKVGIPLSESVIVIWHDSLVHNKFFLHEDDTVCRVF